jgi:hypothetical protein
LGLCVSPSSLLPSPPRSLKKVHLVETGLGQHSLTLSMSEQSSRMTSELLRLHDIATVHTDSLQDLHGLRRMWTIGTTPLNHHVPDLPRYIRGRSDPKRAEDDSWKIIRVLTVPLELGTESRATQRGAPRAPPPHLSPYSSPTRGKAPPATRHPKDQH